MKSVWLIGLTLLVGLIVLSPVLDVDSTSAEAQAIDTMELVSVASNGVQGNNYSVNSSISNDGRYIAFESGASNLVSGDTNNASDIFVRDRQTGQINRISIASNGTQGNSASLQPAISGDGRYVAFNSYASNLVSGDANGSDDIFVYDRQNGQTSLVSVATNGTQGSYSSQPSISADGRYVAFFSLASNIVDGDTNGLGDVFVHDRQTGQTIRVSIASDGTQANGASTGSSISSDGRYITFESTASNLVTGDTNGTHDIFIHDQQIGQTTRISIASDGTQANNASQWSSISGDGRYVAFYSNASNLVNNDTNGYTDVFVHDRQSRQTSRISIASDGTQSNGSSLRLSLSNNGRYVMFESEANNLVSGDTNNTEDVFIHDRQTGQISRVSVATSGTQGNSYSNLPSTSADGRYIAFESGASNLVNNDTNSTVDIFVASLSTTTPPNTQTPTRTPSPTATVTPLPTPTLTIDTSPPPVPNERVFTCKLSGTNGGINNYQVRYVWNAVSDIGTAGMHPYGYWSQISTKADFSVVPQPGWYNSWDDQLQRTSDIAFVENTTLYARIRTRDLYDNQSAWSEISSLVLNTSNCIVKPEPVIFIPGIAGSQLVRQLDPVTYEYFWPIFRDGPKLKMTLNPRKERYSIYTDDVVRYYIWIDIYGYLLNRLEYLGDYSEYLVGYVADRRRISGCDKSQKDATLFVFPWDWRYGVTDTDDPALNLNPNNTALLKEFVDCVRLIHPDSNINIVAHSMGGLLARKYILDNAGNHHISKLITIGTPWFGAPKAIAMMLNGDFEPRLISPDIARTLLEYFPGAHQLLPSRPYYDFVSKESYPFVTLDTNKKLQHVAYDNFGTELRLRYFSPDIQSPYPSTVKFMANNDKLFGDEKLFDWRADNTGVTYFVLYGEGMLADTIGQVRQSLDYTYENGVQKTIYNVRNTLGDGTVPIVSSTRKGSNLNFNGPASLLRFKQRRESEDVSHLGLLSNLRVQNCILKLLGKPLNCDNDQITDVSTSMQVDILSARYIKLWGITSLRVTSGLSTTSNLMTNTLSLSAIFPGIGLNYLGSDAVQLIIPDSNQYTLLFTTSDYFQNETIYGTGESVQQIVRYAGIPIATGAELALITSATDTSRLGLDSDHNNLPDSIIQPTSDLQGVQAQDVTPPIVQIEYAQAMNMVTITATDDNSQVQRVLYSLDGNNFTLYSEPFTIASGARAVHAQAQDKAGNWSSVTTIDLVSQINASRSFLPLIIR